MLQRLQTTLKKGLLLSFLALGLPQVGKADSLQVKKDVFLIDVSRSMQGHGSVSTPNVFDDVKRELITAFGKAKASKAVLIPFSDKVRGGVSVELPQDSSVIHSYIEQLRTSDGRTDIYRAWEVGLDSLHSDASGYRLYLITDALHNSKRYDIDSLRSLLSHWEGEQKDAYLVLLNPAFESSELANIFRANERMYVINSLQDLYNDAQVDTMKTVAVASPQQESTVSTTSSEHSLWWLWLLLALIVVGGVIMLVKHRDKVLDALRRAGQFLSGEIVHIVYIVRSLFSKTPQDVTANVFKEANRYYRKTEGYWEGAYTDVPSEENAEKHTLQELVDDPYRDSQRLFNSLKDTYHLSEESIRLIAATLQSSITRIDKHPLKKLGLLNGQPNFFPRRLGNVVVRSVTAKELCDSGVSLNNVKEAIRIENYRRLGVAFAREWKVSPKMANTIFGALLHCTVHEDIAGYVFLVRVTPHRAISHRGAASKVMMELVKMKHLDESSIGDAEDDD